TAYSAELRARLGRNCLSPDSLKSRDLKFQTNDAAQDDPLAWLPRTILLRRDHDALKLRAGVAKQWTQYKGLRCARAQNKRVLARNLADGGTVKPFIKVNVRKIPRTGIKPAN